MGCDVGMLKLSTQADIIALTPLYEFAAMEPKFSPFKGHGEFCVLFTLYTS